MNTALFCQQPECPYCKNTNALRIMCPGSFYECQSCFGTFQVEFLPNTEKANALVKSIKELLLSTLDDKAFWRRAYYLVSELSCAIFSPRINSACATLFRENAESPNTRELTTTVLEQVLKSY